MASIKKVLVTGATGFLGKYVVDELLEHGYEVYANGRDQKKLDTLKSHHKIQGSLATLNQLSLAVDAVIHCAALSSVWGSKKEFYDANVLGTRQVIDFSRRNGVKRLVHISSPSVYSTRAERLNIKESEVDPKNELTNYIWSKLRSEELVNAANSAFETVILRPRGLIGAEDPSILPRFLKVNRSIGIPLINAGKQLVDLTCVENVALACRLALESEKAPGNTYNITNGEPRELRQVIEQLFTMINEKPKYLPLKEPVLYTLASLIEGVARILKLPAEPYLIRYSVITLAYSQTLDINKARQELNYEPRVNLDQGLANSAKSQLRS